MEKYSCTDVKKKKKSQTKIKRAKRKKYFSYVPVSAMSSFNLIKEFKLVRKKNMEKKKTKMVSMSVFKIKQMCQLPSETVEFV